MIVEERREVIVQQQMEKFWSFCTVALQQHAEREKYDMEHSGSFNGKCIPPSLQTFANDFLERLALLLRAM